MSSYYYTASYLSDGLSPFSSRRSFSSSGYSSSSSSSSRYAVDTFRDSVVHSRYLTSTSRPFRSRFLPSHHRHYGTDSEDDPATAPRSATSRPEAVDPDKADSTSTSPQQRQPEQLQDPDEEGRTHRKPVSERTKRRLLRNATVLNNGSIIRMRRERSSDDEDATSSSESSDGLDGDGGDSSEGQGPPAAASPEPEETIPEPEDPLDVEERELNGQLTLSLTLTLVDEENIRQRLLEIRKTKLRRNYSVETRSSLICQFQKVADVALFENLATIKEDEEKAIMQTLESEEQHLSGVDRKDMYVRLQEIFRDRKTALDQTLADIDQHYEHILQETSTELAELENSTRGKQAQVEKLQEEILMMQVKREMMTKEIETVNEDHRQRQQALMDKSAELAAKMSQYAIVKASPDNQGVARSRPSPSVSSTAAELKEIERELECPFCINVSSPPIYQCEEGHIICANCKPLLKVCPLNCGKSYGEPAIRCRFAEKLADRYFAAIAANVDH